LFFNSIHSEEVVWKQAYNDFHGGGYAQPKLYAAFSKDLRSLPYYVPHSTNGSPKLVYEAQSFGNFPILHILESFLASLGYLGFNYVTVLMYAGDGSHISAHRDREQIYGFETADDLIATYVFGATYNSRCCLV
jgi:hypothetical protein